MGIEIPSTVASGQKAPPDLIMSDKSMSGQSPAPAKKIAEADPKPQKNDIEVHQVQSSYNWTSNSRGLNRGDTCLPVR